MAYCITIINNESVITAIRDLDGAIRDYNNQIKKGWIDMTIDDIIMTSGINGELYQFN